MRNATQDLPAPPRPPAPLGDADGPFGRERTTGLTAIVEERPGRGTRPDPRAEPSIATTLGAVAVARVAVPIASRGAGMKRPERVTTPLAMDAVQPPQAPPPRGVTPPPFGAVQPEPAAAPAQVAGPAQMQSAPEMELPSLDAAEGFPMAEAPPGDFGFGFALADEQPEAKPAALEAAAMMQQIGKMAGDAATQKAAADVATMLKQMAMKGGVDEQKPNPAHSAAKALAAMLAGSAAAPQPAAAVVAAHAAAHAAEPPPPVEPARKAKRAKPKGESRTSSTQMPAVKEDAVPEPAADCTLGPLATPLEDALLSAIADGLRKYPEVEWACEVSDGTNVAVIGVRVAPGFMTNVPEIKQVIARAGESHGTRLSVLLLADPQQMKEARSQGSVFFPWRKRGKR